MSSPGLVIGWTRGVFAMALALSASGCNQNVTCRAGTQAMSQSDGGPFLCGMSEDCPRPANYIVCLSTAPPSQTCVECVNNRCVQVIPEGCP